MCGIAGFVDFNKKSDYKILKNMTDVLHHRGPDDSGYSFYSAQNANIGLGHRRLSILDLSSHGHQPMKFDNLEIVYNGEVYNFKEIRNELEKYGYKFESNSDTEAILKAYHKWGIDAVHKFNGMFAIAIYDKKENKLILIRDRTGVKPLYFYYKNGLFMFASELKSFHQSPYFKKEIDLNILGQYLQFGYILEPYSIFKNTYKLKAGHFLELRIENEELRINEYWNVIDYYNKPKLKISEDEAIEETEEILKSAFRYRLIADVPVGVFLSGGYDSSAVTALLQSEMTDKLNTFTIGFEEEGYNEAPFAKEIAKYLGTNHTEYYCTRKDALEIIPTIPYFYDEPFGDASAIPTILVSKLARQKVTVSLSADGGDEIFGGYDKYNNILKWDERKKYMKFLPGNLIQKFLKKLYDIKILSSFYNIDTKLNKVYAILQNKDLFTEFSKYFIDDDMKKLIKGFECYSKTNFDIKTGLNLLNIILAKDYKTYLVDDILTKVDRATMSVSLEGREPMLDNRIIEFVAQLPNKYKIRNGEKKWLLKQIVHKYLPKEIMDRPKAGFAVPVKKWLLNDLNNIFNYYLSDGFIKKQNIFNINEINKIKNKFENNQVSFFKVWYLIMFQMWWEYWINKK